MSDKLTTAEQLKKCAQAIKNESNKIERLPTVTDADDGKVLRVVDGAWSAAEIGG